MPETPTTYNYYPALSGLMTADDLPEILGFIRDGLQQIFEKVYYINIPHSFTVSIGERVSSFRSTFTSVPNGLFPK